MQKPLVFDGRNIPTTSTSRRPGSSYAPTHRKSRNRGACER